MSTKNLKDNEFCFLLLHEFYHFTRSFNEPYKLKLAYDEYFDILDCKKNISPSKESMKEIIKEEYDADCFAIKQMKECSFNIDGFYQIANAYALKIKYTFQTKKQLSICSTKLNKFVEDKKLKRQELFKSIPQNIIKNIENL